MTIYFFFSLNYFDTFFFCNVHYNGKHLETLNIHDKKYTVEFSILFENILRFENTGHSSSVNVLCCV